MARFRDFGRGVLYHTSWKRPGKESHSGRRSLNYDPQPCSFLSLNSCFFHLLLSPSDLPQTSSLLNLPCAPDVKDCRKGRRLFLLLAPGFLFIEQSEFLVFSGSHIVSRLCSCFIWTRSPLHPHLFIAVTEKLCGSIIYLLIYGFIFYLSSLLTTHW